MDASGKIWVNGSLVRWEDAKVHVLSHALHYGGGVFEGIRFYMTPKGRSIFRLSEHIDRFFYSASVLKMNIPFSKDEIKEGIINVVKTLNSDEGYIRPLAFYGYGKMGLNPKGAKIEVITAAWPWNKYLDKEVVNIKVSNYLRIHPKTTIADAKLTGNYLNSILASLELDNTKYDEALFLDFENNIAEGPGENIFIIKDEILYTPKKGSILPGITRDTVIQIAKEEGYEVKEKVLRLEDLMKADEAFFCGTAVEITGIGSVDDKKIGNGELGNITERLKSRYMDEVRGKGKHKEWLFMID